MDKNQIARLRAEKEKLVTVKVALNAVCSEIISEYEDLDDDQKEEEHGETLSDEINSLETHIASLEDAEKFLSTLSDKD